MLLLATDIFGETDWTHSLVNKWNAKGHKVLCVSPYERRLDFNSEYDAYQEFNNTGGIQAFINKLNTVLNTYKVSKKDEIIALGFSAGASALWSLVSEKSYIKQVIGFYPGQIRHMLQLEPVCPFILIFPKKEEHFEIDEVIQHLVTKQNVEILQVNLNHGYVNPSSNHYDLEASTELVSLLSEYGTQTEVSAFKQLLLFSHSTASYKEIKCISHL